MDPEVDEETETSSITEKPMEAIYCLVDIVVAGGGGHAGGNVE